MSPPLPPTATPPTGLDPVERIPQSSPRAQKERRRLPHTTINHTHNNNNNLQAREKPLPPPTEQEEADEVEVDQRAREHERWKANFRMDRRSLFGGIRQDLTAAALEFVGTVVFLIIGLGGIQAAATSSSLLSAASNTSNGAQSLNTVASIEQLLYISASMGLGLLVAVWLFYRVTGGVFNPAVSTALLLVGAIGPVRFVLYCLAQLLGAIVASAILLGLLPGPLVVTPSLGPNVNPAQGVFIEMFLTSFLVFAVLMLAAEKHRSTAFAPIGVGLTLFASHLFGVLYTGAGMNAARAFGPAVVSGFNREHWVYWLGPFLGSLLATGLYAFLKHVEYWKLNPDQDVDDPQQSPDDPVARARSLSLSVGSRSNGTATNSATASAGRDSDVTFASPTPHPVHPVGAGQGKVMPDARVCASPPPVVGGGGPGVAPTLAQGERGWGEKGLRGADAV